MVAERVLCPSRTFGEGASQGGRRRERGGEGEDTELYGQRVCREDAPFKCVCLPRVRCPRYVPTASRVRARAAESTKKMMNEGGIEQPGVATDTEITDYHHVDPLLGREGDVMDTTGPFFTYSIEPPVFVLILCDPGHAPLVPRRTRPGVGRDK